MGKNFVHLSCKQDTKDLILTECVEEYLRHHKEMRGRNITQEHILKQIAMHYVECPGY